MKSEVSLPQLRTLARSIQSNKSVSRSPPSRISILILSSHLSLGFSKLSISFRFHYKNNVYTSSVPYGATCPAHLVLLDICSNIAQVEDVRFLYWILAAILRLCFSLICLACSFLTFTPSFLSASAVVFEMKVENFVIILTSNILETVLGLACGLPTK